MFKWFADSLRTQMEKHSDLPIQILLVNYFSENKIDDNFWIPGFPSTTIFNDIKPLPSYCQGEHKLTSVDYFDASIARNTGFVYAKYDYCAFVDDCSVLLPGWLDAVIEGMNNKQIILGTYQKHTEVVVENGVLISSKFNPDDGDSRVAHHRREKMPTDSFFGASFGMPLEVALQVNGFDELQCITGYEDSPFGIRLKKAGHTMWFDKRMATVESQEHHFIDVVMKRIDPETTKERYFEVLNSFGVRRSSYREIKRYDASHALMDITRQSQTFRSHHNGYDLSDLRTALKLNGEITKEQMHFPTHWYFTGQELSTL